MSQLAKPVPGDHIAISMDTYTEPFWQAAKEGKLTAACCGNCGHFRMPPTAFCPQCRSQDLRWPELPGTGTIYSYVVCHRSPFEDVADFVYVPVVVDIDGAPGARIVSNLVDVDPDTVAIGQKVKVDWNPIKDGWVIPIFRPA